MTDTIDISIKKETFLSDEEIKNLIRKIKEGDKKSADVLLRSFKSFIWKIVYKYKSVSSKRHLDDMFQEGAIGFLKAVNNYDFRNDASFSSYVKHYIDSEIKIYLTRHTHDIHSFTTKNLVKVRNNIKNYFVDFKISKEAKQQMMKDLNVTMEDINGAIERMSTSTQYIDDQEQNDIFEIVDENNIYEEIEEQNETEYRLRIINENIGKLKEDWQRIIKYRYLSENTKTLSEIALEDGVTAQSVYLREKKAIKRLKEMAA